MMSLANLPETDRLVLLAACSFIILAGMKMAGSFIGPLVLSIFATIIFSIVSRWFQKKGFSARVSSWMAFFLFILCLFGVLVLILLSVAPLIKHISRIESGINENMNLLQVALENVGISPLGSLPINQLDGSLSILSPEMISTVVGQFSALFVVIFTYPLQNKG